jgi:transposase
MVSRQTDKESTSVRVYKYGLVPKGYPTDEAIDELWRANDLWNTLVNIHRVRAYEYEDARCVANILYAEKSEELKRKNKEISTAGDDMRTARMKASTRDGKNPLIVEANNWIKKLKEERAVIYEEIKPLRKEADKGVDKKALNEQYRNSVNAACSVKNSGLRNQTAGQVKENFRTARKQSMKKPKARLNKHSFDGTGFYQYRFRSKGANVDGLSFGELFQGNKPDGRAFTILSRDDSKNKPRLRLRAKLAGGAKLEGKVFQEFDWIYHRPLPEEAQIQNGQIVRSRIGDKFRYDLTLTIKMPTTKPIKVPKREAIGIDLGFRKTKDSIIVATIKSNKIGAKVEEISAPVKLIKAMEHVIDLQSELDDAATDLGKAIRPILRKSPLSEEQKKPRLWKAAANIPTNRTLAYETAYKLGRWMLYEPEALPKGAREKILTWWKSYSRKYRELHNLRRKQLLNRKHFYRQVASDLVRRRILMVLEKINLSVFAETRDKENVLSNKARAQRVMASPAEFRDAIINAAKREGVPYIEVNPAYTSKTCSDCGYLFKELKSEKEWTCSGCGVIHDRDENAAVNIANKSVEYFAALKK